jgi:hypothetical protein
MLLTIGVAPDSCDAYFNVRYPQYREFSRLDERELRGERGQLEQPTTTRHQQHG